MISTTAVAGALATKAALPVAAKTYLAGAMATKAALPFAAKTVVAPVVAKTITAQAGIKVAAGLTAKSLGITILWPVAFVCIGGYGLYKIFAEDSNPTMNPDKKI